MLVSSNELLLAKEKSTFKDELFFGNKKISRGTIDTIVSEVKDDIYRTKKVQNVYFNESYFKILLDGSEFNIYVDENTIKNKSIKRKINYQDFLRMLVRASMEITQMDSSASYDCLSSIDTLEVFNDPEVLKVMNYFLSENSTTLKNNSESLISKIKESQKKSISPNSVGKEHLNLERIFLAQDLLRARYRDLEIPLGLDHMWKNKSWENKSWENQQWENQTWENQTWENHTGANEVWNRDFESDFDFESVRERLRRLKLKPKNGVDQSIPSENEVNRIKTQINEYLKKKGNL